MRAAAWTPGDVELDLVSVAKCRVLAGADDKPGTGLAGGVGIFEVCTEHFAAIGHDATEPVGPMA